MSTVYDLLRKWSDEHGHDTAMLQHHLEKLELEEKIVPKIVSKDFDESTKTREIFDLQSVEVANVKGVEGRALEIKPGITMLYGPNDSGKSTFLDGLELALKGARGENVPALMRRGADEMSAILRATACEIHRTYTRRVATRGAKKGAVTYEHQLFVSIDGAKDDKTEKAQALIQSWADVDLDFVVRCSMVRQGNLAAVLDEESSKRQALFFKLLNLEAADDTRESIAKVSRMQAAKAGASQQLLEPTKKTIEELKRKIAAYKLDQIQTRIAELEAASVGSSTGRVEQEARLSLMNRQLAALHKQREMRDKSRAKQAELNKAPALFMEVVDMAPKFAQAEVNLRAAVASIAKADAHLAAVKEQGTAIKRTGVCVTCGSPAGDATKAAALARLKDEHDKARAAADAARAVQAEVEGQFTFMLNERLRMQQLTAEKRGIHDHIVTLEVMCAQLEIMMGQVDEKSLAQDINTLRSGIAEGSNDHAGAAAKELVQVRAYLAEYEAIKAQIAALERTIADAAKPAEDAYDPAVLELLELAFSKRGIPLWLARGHVARVNAIAAEIAAGDRYRYELGPDLDVVIVDGETEIAPRAASGSSRQRGALVILVAMAVYLQELAAIKIPFLWLDEIPFQDEANQALMVEILHNIGKRIPKLIFGASDWSSYVGKFDHEVAVTPPKRIPPAEGKPAIVPTVKLHSTASMAAAISAPAHAKLETFDDLESKLETPAPPAPPARVDPMTQEIPTVAGLEDDADPF